MNYLLNFISVFILTLNKVTPCDYNITGDISHCLYKIPINYYPDFFLDKIVVDYSYKNKYILNNIFDNIVPDSKIIIGESKLDRYPVRGGIVIDNTKNLIIDLKGIIDFGGCTFSNNLYYNDSNCALKIRNYPGFSLNPSKSNVESMITISNYYNLTITSSNREGKFIGGGDQWYGFLNALYLGDSMKTKPIFLNGRYGNNYKFTMEYVTFHQPAYWTIYIAVDNVYIHNIAVFAHSEEYNKIYKEISDGSPITNKMLAQIKAFNTDGIDIHGSNVYIHDCHIHVGDDCIAVKDGSDWIVEDITASGMGMSIGSVGFAENIVFRNIFFTNTIRAIFVKTDSKNIIFENFYVKKALIFPVWIGPAYQGINNNCPLTWPFISTKLTSLMSYFLYTNFNIINNLCIPTINSIGSITIENITILESATTPFVIIANNNYKISVTNFNVIKTKSEGFPFSSSNKCYLLNSTTSNIDFCNTTSSFGCKTVGNRDAIQPCCEQYYPYKGGKWGYCDTFI
jgi:polygalacturonase